MWSLFKKAGESDIGGIFDYAGEKLPPLKFSNNKTQEDIVTEILESIEQGNKIIFIRGVCGSGKSAIALNLAKHFNKTSIVVPIKSLQEQYEQDYSNNKFILKADKKKLKISIIKGRNNFSCPFQNCKADNPELPCTIELKTSNLGKIKEYIEMNEKVSKNDFSVISDVRRMSIAPVCPYWSPLLPAELNSRALEDSAKKKYEAISGKEYALFHRQHGCSYYDQYTSYIDSDVLIFNSRKYLIETAIGRKPKTDLEIIDECDEFLDNFANEGKINLNRLSFSLNGIISNSDNKQALKEITNLVNELLYDFQQKDTSEILPISEGAQKSYSKKISDIEKLDKTPILNLIEKITQNSDLAEDDEDNYFNKVLETCWEFIDITNETYVSFEKEKTEKGENAYITLVTINLAKRLQEIIDKNKIIVLMSGTLHSEKILKDIFGLNRFKTIEAEIIPPGTITKFRTGLEKNCKYENFKNNIVTRKDYLLALNSCVKNSKSPTLIHVNSFEDLPNELEKAEFKLDSLITKEKLKLLQEHNQVEKFKSGELDVLFTTKCSRGVDFPGDKCNSIILTKYPYPNIQGLFWKILKREMPEKFMEFYLDKARRELLQKIYRGLRFKEDHIILLSPDSRVLDSRIQ